MLRRGLAATAALWPEIRQVYGWVHEASRLLANADGRDTAGVRAAYGAHVAAIAEQRDTTTTLSAAIDHFLKVTQSYAPGLFHCYDLPELPRTNNDLEHVFGATRYHERRASGRKGASPALVVRGAVRLVAAVVTRQRPRSVDELRPWDVARWRELRQTMEYRQEARRAQRRFRRDPATYLATLEAQLCMPTLPP